MAKRYGATGVKRQHGAYEPSAFALDRGYEAGPWTASAVGAGTLRLAAVRKDTPGLAVDQDAIAARYRLLEGRSTAPVVPLVLRGEA